ncbi:MAG: hypothetical protein QOG99_166 [Frankiales bacterium]|jgi:hypothetical protein|nr:hypothetical protein [Frankiales bacterium]
MRRLVVACLLLAACGGGSKAGPKAKADIADLESRAQLTACSPSPQPLTAAAAICLSGSEQVSLATFTGDELRDLWAKAGGSVSGGYLVTGTGWAATTTDLDTANRIAASLGGVLKS